MTNSKKISLDFFALKESIKIYAATPNLWKEIYENPIEFHSDVDYPTLVRACIDYYEIEMISPIYLSDEFYKKLNNQDPNEFYFDLVFICQNHPLLNQLTIINKEIDD